MDRMYLTLFYIQNLERLWMKYTPVYLKLSLSAGLSLSGQAFDLVRKCARDFPGKISYIGGWVLLWVSMLGGKWISMNIRLEITSWETSRQKKSVWFYVEKYRGLVNMWQQELVAGLYLKLFQYENSQQNISVKEMLSGTT